LALQHGADRGGEVAIDAGLRGKFDQVIAQRLAGLQRLHAFAPVLGEVQEAVAEDRGEQILSRVGKRR